VLGETLSKKQPHQYNADRFKGFEEKVYEKYSQDN
jgi:hypothetical protein